MPDARLKRRFDNIREKVDWFWSVGRRAVAVKHKFDKQREVDEAHICEENQNTLEKSLVYSSEEEIFAVSLFAAVVFSMTFIVARETLVPDALLSIIFAIRL